MSLGSTGALIGSIVGTALIAGVAMKTVDMVNNQTKSTKKKSKGDHDMMMGYGFNDGYKTKRSKGKGKKSKKRQNDMFDFGSFY
jgi:hypothetical protein